MRITNFLRYGPLALALLLTGCNREEEIAKWPKRETITIRPNLSPSNR